MALDLSQRTAEACLKSRQAIVCFRKYLLGIAVMVLKDHLRTEARKQSRQPDLELLTAEQLAGSPEEWVSAKRERRLLLRALRCLPLSHQLLLELRYWEQLSDRDIAEVLGWPPGTVKTRLGAGMRRLRAEMARLAGSPELLRSTMDSLEQWVSRTQERRLHETRAREQTPGGTDLAQGSGSITLPLEAGTLDGVPVAVDDNGGQPLATSVFKLTLPLELLRR